MNAGTTADIVGAATPGPAGPPAGPAPEHPFASPTNGARRRLLDAARLIVALAVAVVVYAAFLVAKGASPGEVFQAMWDSAFGDPDSFGETLLRTAPLLLGALAVALPARAGLFNIGGQGQMLMGAIFAVGVSHTINDSLAAAPTLMLMGAAAALGGVVWAAVPALLKITTRANEIITSLLLNYVAAITLNWLVFEPWKDPQSLGQAYSKELVGPQRLPILWGDRVNVGILLAPVAALGVYLLLRRTRWGFRIQVLGGNQDAARRAGFNVAGLTVSALIAGGALAGLAGFVEIAGVEGRLRPDVMPGYGYIAFLAAWLARHNPLRCIWAAFVLAVIAVGGNGLKISAGLSGAAVNVLMALVLLAVLGWGRKEQA